MDSDTSELRPNEQLIWIGARKNPAAPIYNMVSLFSIAAEIDPVRFESSFRRLVSESTALRTVFRERDGQAQKLVRSKIDCGVPLIELGDSDDPRQACTDWVDQRRGVALDPTERVFDTALLKLADDHHVWYLNQHHIITDAWSTSLVYHRMAELYSGDDTHVPADTALPTRATQAEPDPVKAYWESQLQQWRSLNGLSLYGSRPPDNSTESVRVSTNFGVVRSERIEKAALAEGLRSLNRDVSLFQIFTTLLFAVLYRASTHTSLVIGAPSAQRSTRAEKRAIGLFMEIFPLGVQIASDETFQTLYDKVAASSVDFFRHAKPGYSNAQIAGSFEVLLNYVKAAFAPFGDAPVQARFIHSGASEPQHLIRVQVNDFEDSETLAVDFDFNLKAFGKSEQELIIDAFLRMTDAFLQDRSQRIDSIDLLDGAQRELLLHELNQAAQHDDRLQRIEVDIAAHARHDPEKPAIRFGGSVVSYRRLVQTADQLSGVLRDAGVSSGQRVAIALPLGIDLIVAMIATLNTGAAYVPVDCDLPHERQRDLLSRSTPSATITTSRELAGIGPAQIGKTICIDRDPPHTSSQDTSEAAIPLDDVDGAAYVLFTSGSTGQPNGVVCHHRGVVNLLNDFEDRGPLPESAVCSWWTSPGFDVSVYEIFSALAFGRCVDIVPGDIRPDPDRFYDWLCQREVQSAYVPPFMLKTFAARSISTPGRLKLRRLLVGVEPIAKTTLADIAGNNSGLRIINGYGPTETTVCATLYSVPENERGEQRTPIGRPVRNNRAYVLDQLGQPVPYGVPGELYIGGWGVAHGYLNQTELTDQRFVDDPFLPDEGGRLYRTGDRVRYLPDGNLEFLGRVDHQLKIRGLRIEPSEIEHALCRHPAVSDALVTIMENGEHRQLLAYTICDPDTAPDNAAWFRFLSCRLPAYMIPSHYVALTQFPLSPNGKIDRSALPLPEVQQKPDKRAPGNPTERELVAIWEKVIGVHPIGVDDNFLELGGDSLRAMQIATQAREVHIGVTPRQLFEHQTVAQLARVAVAVESTSATTARSTAAAERGSADDIDVRSGVSDDALARLLSEYGDDD